VTRRSSCSGVPVSRPALSRHPGWLLLPDRSVPADRQFSADRSAADRLLDIDHLSEDGIRAKMESQAFDGDRLSALRLYEEWRDIGQELGATPSVQVQASRSAQAPGGSARGCRLPNVPLIIGRSQVRGRARSTALSTKPGNRPPRVAPGTSCFSAIRVSARPRYRTGHHRSRIEGLLRSAFML